MSLVSCHLFTHTSLLQEFSKGDSQCEIFHSSQTPTSLVQLEYQIVLWDRNPISSKNIHNLCTELFVIAILALLKLCTISYLFSC